MLKKGAKFIEVEKDYIRKEINGLYEWKPIFLWNGMYECFEDCDFEYITKDWNNDGDIYPSNCCLVEGKFGREYITKDNFDFCYIEYKQEIPQKKYVLRKNNSNKIKEYSKIMEFLMYNTKLVLLEVPSRLSYTSAIDSIIIAKEEFEKEYLQIDENSDYSNKALN